MTTAAVLDGMSMRIRRYSRSRRWPTRQSAGARTAVAAVPDAVAAAIAYLDLFEPRREFKLESARTAERSGVVAGRFVVALGLTALAFVVVPTPDQAIAHRLRAVARAIDTYSATPADKDLAKAMRDVARDLENPKLPAEQKLQELAAMKQELEQIQQQRQSGDQHGEEFVVGGSG